MGSIPEQRVDQLCVVISNPVLQVRHNTNVEIRGLIVNFSPQELHVIAHGWGLSPVAEPGIPGQASPSFPSVLPARQATAEMTLLTLQINLDAFDAIENMMVGNIYIQYGDASGAMFKTAPALFQLILQQ